jgi:hypothetical protein
MGRGNRAALDLNGRRKLVIILLGAPLSCSCRPWRVGHDCGPAKGRLFFPRRSFHPFWSSHQSPSKSLFILVQHLTWNCCLGCRPLYRIVVRRGVDQRFMGKVMADLTMVTAELPVVKVRRVELGHRVSNNPALPMDYWACKSSAFDAPIAGIQTVKRIDCARFHRLLLRLVRRYALDCTSRNHRAKNGSSRR